MNYKFELERGSKKHFCPACKRKTFVRYVAIETGEYLPDEVGRCDREVKCGYHLRPREYFQPSGKNPLKKGQGRSDERSKSLKLSDEKPVFVPDEAFSQSLQHVKQNNLFQFMAGVFGAGKTLELFSLYCIGSSSHWPGASVFWYVDQFGRVTRGKIMLYDQTGHRVKRCMNSVHNLMSLGELPDLHLYGLHLLKLNRLLPVAIVESEKSAILAAGYFKGFIWMASGSLSTLTAERLKPLTDREIILFPDGGAFEKWHGKAEKMKGKFNIRCSKVLESRLSDEQRAAGYDLGDLIVSMLKRKNVKRADMEEGGGINFYSKHLTIDMMGQIFCVP